MGREVTSSRRAFLRTTGASVGLAAIAGCSGGGGGGTETSGGGGGGTETTGGGGGTTAGGATTSAPQGSEIVVGNAAPLSGNIAPWGKLHRAGLDFAAKELNDQGGIDGRSIKVVSQDTEANPQQAATVFRRLVSSERAVATTGPVLSNVGINLRQVAEDEQVPLIPNLAASANLLTKDSRYTFRLAGAATPWLARAIAGYIQQNGWTKYGAIIADYAYGHSYQQAMEKFITSIDGLDSTVEVASVSAQDFTSQLRKMPDDLEFLDAAGDPIGIYTIVKQALDLGLQPAAMVGATLPSGQFYGALGDTVTKGLTTFPPVDVTDQAYLDVANRYYKATGDFFDPFVAFGYDTVHLIKAAIDQSGDASAKGIRDGLSAVEYDTILSYPLVSYTEWGELEQTKLVGQQFVLEAPDYYPDGKYSFKNVYETEVFGPVDPTNWG